MPKYGHTFSQRGWSELCYANNFMQIRKTRWRDHGGRRHGGPSGPVPCLPPCYAAVVWSAGCTHITMKKTWMTSTRPHAFPPTNSSFHRSSEAKPLKKCDGELRNFLSKEL